MTRKALTTVAVLFALAVTVPLVAASPAHATAGECVGYLKDHNYDVTAWMTLACNEGETGRYGDCLRDLMEKGNVDPGLADEACSLAGR